MNNVLINFKASDYSKDGHISNSKDLARLNNVLIDSQACHTFVEL
jgi:hypothetical protein